MTAKSGLRSDIVDEALEMARLTLRNQDSRDPAGAKKQVLDAFAELGLKPRDLEAYLGHKTDVISPAELQDLRGVYRAIKDGEATWADYMAVKNADQEKALAKTDALKERIRAGRRPKAGPSYKKPEETADEEKTQADETGPDPSENRRKDLE